MSSRLFPLFPLLLLAPAAAADQGPPLTWGEREHVRWKAPLPDRGNASPAVIVGDHAYLVNEPGTASCFEPTTGKDLWKQERLSGKTWGSFVHAAGRLYVTATDGETVVVKADPKLEELARNKLPDEVLASIAVSDGELFIRGYKYLWCISK